jgi:hypothetical protein
MQMAEAKDLRFSFDLSRGCSQELNLHCEYHLLPNQIAQTHVTWHFSDQTRVLLLQLQMAEAEYLRFSFDLSRGCSQGLTLGCSYHLLPHHIVQAHD